MSNAPQGPAAIMQIFQGPSAAAALASAIQLGVFASLDAEPLDAEAVAGRIGCPARSTRLLLDALVGIALLKKEAALYALAPTAREHLVPGKPMYVGDFASISFNPTMWAGLGRLPDAVRAGGSVMHTHAETPENEFWEAFARGSAAIAFPGAAALADMLGDVLASKPKARVLDVAAGSGIYAYTLAKRPNVEATLLDWPNVLVETKKWGKKLGVDESRVRYVEGNLFEVAFGGPYDVVLLSNILHHFDRETCASLARKAAAATAPGGRVVVQEFLTDEVNGVPGAPMFGITMLVSTRKGQPYGSKDYRAWLEEAGLVDVAVRSLPPSPSGWIVGTKK